MGYYAFQCKVPADLSEAACWGLSVPDFVHTYNNIRSPFAAANGESW